MQRIERISSNLETEFNKENAALNVMSSTQPDKVNFLVSIGPL